jgi:hypothetical protein
MDQKIKSLSSTTFCGRRFRRQQIADIQSTVNKFSNLSRSELALTICEHLNWVTPRGTNKLHTCLNTLEEMEKLGIFTLPPKIEQKKKTQKAIKWTGQTNEPTPIVCALDDLMPINLQIVTEKEQINQWNEFVDRYHYLGYRHPMGSHLRYYIVDRNGSKLGCFLFSFATWILYCRDKWIGWTDEQRKKHLNLVINNNRFLIFPWVKVKHLASKALSLVIGQIADDWETHHGFRPVLLETFIDPTKYNGTCYKACNWQHIGMTGQSAKKFRALKSKKVYVYPLTPDACTALTDQKKSPSKKAQPFKTANLPADSHISLWQKIIIHLSMIADEYDKKWQKRRRILDTLLIMLFIFRLVFSKNKQGYGTTIVELWDYCKKMNIKLPQSKPVTQAAFGNARAKLDETIFKTLNTEVIRAYETDRDDFRWKNHKLFAVDGTKINLPKQLQKYCSYRPRSNNAYYPQGLVICLYQLKSKIPVDFDLSASLDERHMAVKHLNVVNKDDVIIYDRGYFSYFMLYLHHKIEVHAVFRLKANCAKVIDDFIASKDIDRLVVVEPSKDCQRNTRKQHPEIEFIPLSLRLIKYVVSDTTYIIGTTLTDTQQYKPEEFSDIYHSRWGVEELYKISKVLIDVEDFHGLTERGVKQELFAHFVLITFARIFANQSNDILMLNNFTERTEKTKANLKNCLTTIARNLEALFLQQIQRVKETITTIINLVSSCRQKERANRSYLRVSHKPRKKWELAKHKRSINITATAT